MYTEVEKCLLIMATLLTTSRAAKPPDSYEKNLTAYLLAGYDRYSRPIADSSQPIEVRTKLHLLSINDLNERDQTLSTFAWINMEWKDDYLAWDEADFGGLDHTVLPPTKVWLPDVALMNSVDEVYNDDYSTLFRVEVFSDGTVEWFPGGLLRTQCELDVTFFPFDEQECHIEAANWAYNGHQVHLTNGSSEVDLSEYVKNGEWSIIRTETSEHIHYHDNEPGVPFPKVYFTLYLRRKILYHLVNVVLPVIIMSILSLTIFFTPADAGEKVSLGITILLSFAVYLVLIEDSMARTSNYVPVITIYLTSVMAVNAVSLIITIGLLHLYHPTSGGEIPSSLRKFTYGFCAKLVCMKVNPNPITDISPSKVSVTSSLISLSQSEKDNGSTKSTDKNVLEQVLIQLQKMNARMKDKEKEEACVKEWRLIASILDRFCLLMFFIITAFISVVLLGFYPLGKTTY